MTAETSPETTDIVDFVALRGPASIEDAARARHYIDDVTATDLGEEFRVTPTRLLAGDSPSPVARAVFAAVFDQGRDFLLIDLLEHCPSVSAQLDPLASARPGGYMTFDMAGDRGLFDFRIATFAVPDRHEDLSVPGMDVLVQIGKILRGADMSVTDARRAVREALHQPSIWQGVFAPSGDFGIDIWALHRALFDRLYLLYALRRSLRNMAPVRMEPTIEALQVVHTLMALAIDDALQAFAGKPESGLASDQRRVLKLLRALREPLRDWQTTAPFRALRQVPDRASLTDHLSAVPVVHPVFARGLQFRTPFNTVRPVGVGDLRVVRQRLTGYKVGEISYIHNVLMGETRDRRHRRVERSEDTFVTTAEQSQETTRDFQATDRFELKREAEETLKQSLGVNVNGSITYDSKPIVTSASAGFSFNSSHDVSDRSSETIVREAISKTVSRIAARNVEQRTSVRFLETEEENKQVFDAKQATRHVSGIYRWVDKTYEAQIWNLGRRMMFEFIIPEPAAFLVEARLRAYAQSTPLPSEPVFTPVQPVMPPGITQPADITTANYATLALTHDLADLPPPRLPARITGVFRDKATGQATWSARWPEPIDDPNSGNRRYRTSAITCTSMLSRYTLTSLRLVSHVRFHEANTNADGTEIPALPGGVNRLDLLIDGRQVFSEMPGMDQWQTWDQTIDVSGQSLRMQDETEVLLGLNDPIHHTTTVHFTATLADDGMADWRQAVFARLHGIAAAKADDDNKRLRAQFDADHARYKARMSELRAMAANDLLGGASGLLNAKVIHDELKKHCITMVAREFDTDQTGDLLATGAMGNVTTDNSFYVLTEPPSSQIAPRFQSVTLKTETGATFPAIDIPAARQIGPMVQFLEQAFEWANMAYVFYPYFWAAMPRWVELMNRSAPSDPVYASFLQAGSARVLIAVSPSYENAVLHFIATGRPWDGGPSPVIGDPLFLPLFEEIRKQQQAGQDGTPEGSPWSFTLPTSLVYLQDSSSSLPSFLPPPAP